MAKTGGKTALQKLERVEFSISMSARPDYSWSNSRSAGGSVTVPLSGVATEDIRDALTTMLVPAMQAIVLALAEQLEEMATAHLDAERDKQLAKEAAEAAKEK